MFTILWDDIWLVLFILLIAIGVFASQGLLMGLGVMGLLAMGMSWIWNKLSLEDVHYERKISQSKVFIGEEITISFVATNHKPVPLGRLLIEDEIPDQILFPDANVITNTQAASNTLRHSTSLAWYERIKWSYTITSGKRGFYRIGPARLESGDLFGFFRSQKHLHYYDHILVYPKVVTLPELGIPSTRPLGETRGGIAIFQDPSRPQGVREYQVGDPMKTVDWKVSAKMQHLQVRTFEPSSGLTVVLVVAIETAKRSWEGYVSADLEAIIVAAASLAAYASDQEYSLGLFSNGTPILVDRPMNIPPTRSPEQLKIILEALATIQPLPVRPMALELTRKIRQFPIGATLVIVAALISDDMVEAMLNLKRQGYAIVLVHVGNRECPEIPEGILVHRLNDYLESKELAGEFGPA